MTRTRRGVALIVVLWIIVLLTSVTAVASSAARSSGDIVAARRAQATARSMAQSGVAVAVTMLDSTLRALQGDAVATAAYLNALDAGAPGATRLTSPLGDAAQDTVGDGAFATAIVDVSARLDVNEAGEDALARFLSAFVPLGDARLLAAAVERHVRGGDAERSLLEDSLLTARSMRDSVARALLGRPVESRHALTPLGTLDELATVEGFSTPLLERIAPFLTVDGDGRINRRSAPPEVRAAATGSLVDQPSRLLVITRGWRLGHPLTREIQAVYDVATDGLRLVRWRERDL